MSNVRRKDKKQTYTKPAYTVETLETNLKNPSHYDDYFMNFSLLAANRVVDSDY